MGWVLLLSDIHANAYALEAVLSDARQKAEIEAVWFLGDLLGYGPSPLEVLQQVREEGVYQPDVWILGNHDKALARVFRVGKMAPEPPAGTSPQAWASWLEHWKRLREDPEHRAWYQNFLQNGQGPRIFHAHGWEVVMIHGALIRNMGGGVADAIETYAFPWVSEEAKRAYFLSPLKGQIEAERCVVLFGHTHVPMCQVVQKEGAARPGFVELLHRYDVPVSLGGQGWVLINPGSVGQPRDGDSRAAYALLNLEKGEIVFHRVSYPVKETAKALTRLGWYELAQRLVEGSLARSREEIGDYLSILEERKGAPV